jgi:hypothetical protein
VRWRTRQQPRSDRFRRVAQQLTAKPRRQVDPDPCLGGKFRIGFSLRQNDSKSGRGNPRTGIADQPPTNAWVPAGQQRVGDDFLQPPSPRNGQQVLLAFCFRDFDQVFRAQSGRFRQDRSGDRDLVVHGKAADNGGRRLADGSKLNAHLSQRDPRTHICDRPDLYRLDESFKQITEQLDLLMIEAASGRQKKIRNTLDRFQALFRRSDTYRRFNFVDD